MSGLFFVLAGTDMGIKQYMEDTFEKNEEKKTIVPKVVLRKVHNKGFCLNLLDQYPEVIRGGSCAVGILTVLYDLWLSRKKGQTLTKAGMAFVSAGAASNIYDRLVRKHVVDYIGVRVKNRSISRITANLADIYVVIGMILVLIGRSVHGRRKER